MPKSTC
jgi:hypothetical protein